MTAQLLTQVEYEIDHEEFVRLLAAPDQRDPRDISDPIALFGAQQLDPDPVPGSLVPGMPIGI
jgi:hypothetical protein